MLKIGLLGCGTMGRTHALAYKKITNAEVVGVYDIDSTKADVIAKELNTNKVGSFQELIDLGIDILDVCLPTFLHAEFSIAAMNKGIHVFCEKPIALNLLDAKKMIDTATKNQVKLTIGHVLRFFPQYINAIDSIKNGAIGNPKLIRTARNQAFPTWSWENWYNDYDKSGGPILDLIIHDIDWITHNFGKVDRVFSQTVKERMSVDMQDHVQCLLKLKNGGIAYLEGSWALPMGSPFRMAYEVVGTSGQIEYDSTVHSSIKLQTNNGAYQEYNTYPFSDDEEPYFLELQSFVNAVRLNKDTSVPPTEAMYSLEVALACFESSKNNRAIELG